MKTSTKIISLIIIISFFAYVNADSDEKECDAICELFWDAVSFIAGMLWRACMDSPECRMVAIPTVLVLGGVSLFIALVMKCIYGHKHVDEPTYHIPKARRAVAFGAGYMCG